MQLRHRMDTDLSECSRLAAAVHAVDGYPGFLPDDVRSFLTQPESIVAWVAEDDAGIVGPSLNRTSSPAVMALVSESTCSCRTPVLPYEHQFGWALRALPLEVHRPCS